MAVFQPALPMRGVTPQRATIDILELTFQPALPMRGVTQPLRSDADLVHISTRTPHAGSDA